MKNSKSQLIVGLSTVAFLVGLAPNAAAGPYLFKCEENACTAAGAIAQGLPAYLEPASQATTDTRWWVNAYTNPGGSPLVQGTIKEVGTCSGLGAGEWSTVELGYRTGDNWAIGHIKFNVDGGNCVINAAGECGTAEGTYDMGSLPLTESQANSWYQYVLIDPDSSTGTATVVLQQQGGPFVTSGTCSSMGTLDESRFWSEGASAQSGTTAHYGGILSWSVTDDDTALSSASFFCGGTATGSPFGHDSMTSGNVLLLGGSGRSWGTNC